MSTSGTIATLASFGLLVAGVLGGSVFASQGDVFDRVTHGQASSEGGVRIHYASLGQGPLVVMIHGFPDFWYSWRHQMAALSQRFQVVAIDQRGYNLSDKPKGVEQYDMALLVADVAAVIRHLGRDSRDDRRARLGRRRGMERRDEDAADGRQSRHPQPPASQRPGARAAVPRGAGWPLCGDCVTAHARPRVPFDRFSQRFRGLAFAASIASHAVTIASRPRARIPSDFAGLRRCNIRRHLDPPARRASPLPQAERAASADAARALHAA